MVDKTWDEPTEKTPETPAGDDVAKAAPAAPQPVTVDATNANSHYSNFCRITGTPEEVLLDLGLNENPMNAPTGTVAVTQRVVMNYFTAKRLLGALQLTVQRHEAAFGAIETDVQKRVSPRGR